MRGTTRLSPATVIAVLSLVVAMSGTAVAATGGTLLLGRGNSAGATTSVANDGAGPALSLRTAKSTTPNLAVSNSARIPRLNADLLDGMHATAFPQRILTVAPAQTSEPAAVATGGNAGPFVVETKQFTTTTDEFVMLLGGGTLAISSDAECSNGTGFFNSLTWQIDADLAQGGVFPFGGPGSSLTNATDEVAYLPAGQHTLTFLYKATSGCTTAAGTVTLSHMKAVLLAV
jgi:hypothetical protein